MSDHSGLRYLFDQSNLNARKARWLSMISDFYFEIRYIKGKENRVAYALSRGVQVNHVADMSSYGTELQDWILQEGKYDGRYMEIMHRLKQGISGEDVDYRLTTDSLVIFRNKIYVSNDSENKKTIL